MAGRPVLLAAPVRTPIGRFGGGLAALGAVELGVAAARACIERAGIDPASVQETFVGHARQAGCGPNPARQIAMRAGCSETAPAMTLNQACASGMRAVMLAARAVAAGERDLVLAGGVESMSNTPYLLPELRWGLRMGDRPVVDGMYKDGFQCPIADQLMGRTAENLAEQYDLSRAEQDEFAARSQQRCEAARKAGRFREELVAVSVPGRKGEALVEADEHPRDGVTAASLAKLEAVFKAGGTVHAGNSSGVTDGAAALLVLSEEAASRLGIEPMARWVADASAGVDPRRMGIGPVPAVRELLDRTGLALGDIDLVELNEAFAAQVLACDRELGFDPEKLNVNGGAIALGHPIGCTGARILVTLLHELRRRNTRSGPGPAAHPCRRGLATLCVSGGMGVAGLVECV